MWERSASWRLALLFSLSLVGIAIDMVWPLVSAHLIDGVILNQQMSVERGVRIVPGGSAVRRGAHLAAGVVCMPIKYASTPRLVAFERRIRACIGTALHIVIARRAGFAKEV